MFLSIFILNASNCKSKNNDIIPECIQEKIKEIASQNIANPPIKIYTYSYNDETVYYTTAKCCDFYSMLYDENCNLICSPDEKLIWSDERKY